MIISNHKYRELFGEQFELIESGYNTGDFNMDFDLERAKECSEGKVLPMLRLYGWKPWAVSLGYNQKSYEINEDLCKEKGFDLVRRPTGGRAVLHANELTYSVVLPLPDGKNIHDVYKEIHIILLKAFQSLGTNEIDFEKSQTNFNDFYQKTDVSISCFASSARYEIEWNRRKIVGSAQRLIGNTVLQHGSILLDKGHEQIADVASTKSEERKIKLKKYILEHSATLTDACQRIISYEECSEAIRKELLR